MPWHLTLDYDSYETAREEFTWDLPEDYNAARDFLRKHDDPDATALSQAYPDGRRREYSFAELDTLSNQFAHALEDLGVERGDVVGIVLSQKPANPITHLACWKLGAISLPLSILFGPDALEYRLDDSGAKAVVADVDQLDTIEEVRPECPDLEYVISVDAVEPPADVMDFDALLEPYPGEKTIVPTDHETPGTIIYTSGSTGPPKGVVHGQGVWLGHCPAFYMYFERDVFDSTFWTPADWAWIGALGDLVFPAWHYGRPVVGYPMGKFDAETAYEIMEEFGVTDTFLPPTAIRMMMHVDDPEGTYDLALNAICSGGEPLTPEILEWGEAAWGDLAINELYGQTEANLLATNCRDWFDPKVGSMGKPVPGHDLRVVDQHTGQELVADEVGMLAVRHGDDPVIFQEYLGQPEKTANARVGDWHLTGDLGYYDDEGYVWFKSRDDDVIITAGYRVGPGEVEAAILEHPDVEQVGVVGIPDDTRGEIIKAFVQPVAGVTGDDELREAITDLVSEQLAKYEYPREIEFVDALPQTTTGKIQRRKLRERETAGE